jgi:hypothetical protein
MSPVDEVCVLIYLSLCYNCLCLTVIFKSLAIKILLQCWKLAILISNEFP